MSIPVNCPACGLQADPGGGQPVLLRRDAGASLMVASNKSFGDWGEVFNDRILATIPGRLLRHATTAEPRPR